jgi:hypothetical protein
VISSRRLIELADRALADRALEALPAYVSPGPWTVRQFAYERFAILDVNGAEVAEVTRRGDADLIAAARNALMGSR